MIFSTIFLLARSDPGPREEKVWQEKRQTLLVLDRTDDLQAEQTAAIAQGKSEIENIFIINTFQGKLSSLLSIKHDGNILTQPMHNGDTMIICSKHCSSYLNKTIK
jgi:hypothetical protein